MAITAFYTWSTGDTITAARLNGNISAIIDGGVGNYDSQHATNGTHKSITTSGTITAATGLTVTAGGATVTAGGITVTAGDVTVTTGNLTLSNGALAITSGNATLSSGNLTLTSGDITLTSGNLVISDMATNSLVIADGSEVASGATSGIPLVTNATGSAPAFGQITVKSKLPDVSQQLSASITIATASATVMQVANSTVSLTTLGRPVFVGLISDSAAITTSAASFIKVNDPAGGEGTTARIAIYRDATMIALYSVGVSVASDATETVERSIDDGNIFTIDPVGAGTYVYTIYVGTEGANDTITISKMKLVAYEL